MRTLAWPGADTASGARTVLRAYNLFQNRTLTKSVNFMQLMKILKQIDEFRVNVVMFQRT